MRLWVASTGLLESLGGAARWLAEVRWGPNARARRRLDGGGSTVFDRELVTMEGKVLQPAVALVAPLSGKPCVEYLASATLYASSSARNPTPIDGFTTRRMVSFEIKLDDGIAMIDGDDAQLAARPVPIVPRKLERECEFLVQYRWAKHLAVGGSFAEIAIAPGDRIRVEGVALLEAAREGERGYRDGATRVRLIAHAAHPLTIDRLPSRRRRRAGRY